MSCLNRITCLLIIITIPLLATSCAGKSSPGKKAESEEQVEPDTGYTGIKKYYRGNRLVNEVTFKNGVRNGEMRTYYPGGQLYQTFNYVNGLREDSSRWYYTEGQVFRSTPYKHDTIDGIQKQYYRTGRLKAKITYVKGLRAPYLEEFTATGKLVRNYPEITYNLEDNYAKTGRIRVNLDITNSQSKVKFYIGEFTNGVFDTTKCVSIKNINGKHFVDLKKSGTEQSDYIGIIASIITDFGNSYLTYKKIELPYKDLK